MKTEIIIGIVGLIIALATLLQGQKAYRLKSNDTRNKIDNLKILFKVNQSLSIEIQNLLKRYINKNKSSEKLIFENMTFSEYLVFVKTEYELNLSDNIYEKLSQNELTSFNVTSLQQSLEKQFENLTLVKNRINTLN